jgi:hypothetical protein
MPTKNQGDFESTGDGTPYFFLFNEKYIIGTPIGIGASERTMDIHFHDFARNYELQAKLKLASAALIRPAYRRPIAYPLEGQELVDSAAGYLAAFAQDSQEQSKRRAYLKNDGVVRILLTDDTLRAEIKTLMKTSAGN